jgi:hypothetical protein
MGNVMSVSQSIQIGNFITILTVFILIKLMIF